MPSRNIALASTSLICSDLAGLELGVEVELVMAVDPTP
jgi:hypothetical protein